MFYDTFFELFTLWIVLALCRCSRIVPQKTLSSAFEYVGNEKKLQFSGFGTHIVASESKCGLICSRETRCISFSVCTSDPITCTLHANDVFSHKKGVNILENHVNCKYYAMKKESVPICRTKGMFVNIRNDSQSTLCNIQMKRVDAAWSQWRKPVVTTNSNSEYKEVARRSVLIAEAHGGFPGKCTFALFLSNPTAPD